MDHAAPSGWKKTQASIIFAHLSVALAAAFGPLLVLWVILEGSPQQYGDYFDMLHHMFEIDGTLLPSGLLVHQNEHLVLLPKLIYLLNITFFGGSNISLGVFVWSISVATAATMAYYLRPMFAGTCAKRAAILLSLSVLIFPMAAAHNYLYAMSGTCWILANFFAVCALIAMASGRLFLSAGFGILGTFTYGTSLAIWPALAVQLAYQRRFGWRELLLFVAGGGSVLIERFTSVAVAHHPSISFDPITVLKGMMIAAGALLTGSGLVAALYGAVMIWLSLLLAARYAKTKIPANQTVFLLGLLAYGLAVLLMFSMSRIGFGYEMLMSSRYMAVVSLFVLGLILLSASIFPENRLWYIATLGSLATIGLHGYLVLTKFVTNGVTYQNLGAVAVRLDLANDNLFEYRSGTSERLKALDHFPYGPSGEAISCGLLGQDLSGIGSSTGSVTGAISQFSPLKSGNGIFLSGWVQSNSPVECILFIERDGTTVVGAAVGEASLMGRSDERWQGIARATKSDDLRVAVKLVNEEEFKYLPD